LTLTGTGHAASGTWSMTVVGNYAGGGTFRCSTGLVRWPAVTRKARKSALDATSPDAGGGGGSFAATAAGNSFGFNTQASSPGTRPASWSSSRPVITQPQNQPVITQQSQSIDLKGQVLYEKRNCYAAPSSPVPLANATIFFRAANGVQAAAPLDALGRYQLTIVGTLPVTASVRLASARIVVRPDLPVGPYQLPLGDVAIAANPNASTSTPTPKLVSVSTISGDVPAGAANIFVVLDHAAQVAAAASPVPIPQVSALWLPKPDLSTWLLDNGLHTNTRSDPDGPWIIVGGSQDRSIRRDEWEEFPLTHEYGHLVLHYLADSGSPGGSHTFTGVYPDRPGLPWDEGFSNFFAAAVTNNPTPTLECQPLTIPTDTTIAGGSKSSGAMNLTAVPAQPAPNDPTKAQYNEIAVAGTLWQLANFLGSNIPQQGLPALLKAIAANPPHSTREFRDALLKDSAVENGSNHDQIENIFDTENIRWAVSVLLTDVDTQIVGGECAGCLASAATQIVADGPYGRCGPTSTGGVSVDDWYPWGDLNYTLDTGCNVIGSDGTPPPQSGRSGGDGGLFFTELPFNSDGSHLRPDAFTVSARWLCTNVPGRNGSDAGPAYDCPSTRAFQVTVYRSLNTTDEQIKVSANLTFTQGGGLIPIAKFDGQGHCQLLLQGPPAGDCSG
jgi:hypothetical protein